MPEPVTFGAPNFVSGLRYRDPEAAIDWLKRVLGFIEHAIYRAPEKGTIVHAELILKNEIGTGMVMLGAVGTNPEITWYRTPQEAGGVTSSFYLVVPDCVPLWRTAQESGADIVAELKTMDYGGGAFALRDPEGFVWSVGEYNPWTVAEAKS